MFEKNNKRRIYWLMDQYLANSISAIEFSNEYYYCYDLGIGNNELTELEDKYFNELSIVASRFSPYEEDFKNCPGAFFSEEELKQKVVETKKILLGK